MTQPARVSKGGESGGEIVKLTALAAPEKAALTAGLGAAGGEGT